MTEMEFRKIALGMNGAVEGAHMGHADFRVGKKIFATLGAVKGCGMVKLTAEQQREFVEERPDAFTPAAGAWGRNGATVVKLNKAETETVGRALTLAFRNFAPRQTI